MEGILTISQVTPYVLHGKNVVGAWRFRATVTIPPSFQAFDFFTLPVPAPKPLEAWTQAEVIAFLERGLEGHPGLVKVRELARFRATYDERGQCSGVDCPHTSCFDFSTLRSE